MYVGAAIRERTSPDEEPAIVGVVSVGKPVSAFSPFIANARQKLFIAGGIAVGAFALLLLMVTVWLVRPFGLVTDLWRALRSQPGGTGRVLNPFRVAFADVRDALAGKSYVDEYVATLTHEIKSPLAAIRGAAELLREPVPEDARIRFTQNIEEQVARAQDLVDRMLELSSLERRARAGTPRSAAGGRNRRRRAQRTVDARRPAQCRALHRRRPVPRWSAAIASCCSARCRISS